MLASPHGGVPELRLKMPCRTILLVAAAGMASSIYAAEIASATISSTQLDATDWQYNLTLTDAGTTDVGTFWFSWVPGEDFMGVAPSGVSSPAGWTDNVTNAGAADGFAIQWLAGPGDALTPGDSLAGFQFDSTLSPADMAADSPFFPTTPVLTSFVYSGAPFSDAGFQFLVQPVAAAAAPEPVSGALAMFGAGVLVFMRRRRHTRLS
jgi:MYXO-CTERM domain-containing protein